MGSQEKGIEQILPQKKPTYQHLGFGLAASRTVKESVSAVLRHSLW
jgi:hypothetical protein